MYYQFGLLNYTNNRNIASLRVLYVSRETLILFCYHLLYLLLHNRDSPRERLNVICEFEITRYS